MTPEMTLAKALSTPQINFEKTASLENSEVQEAMEKLAWAEDVGRELAQEHTKEAFDVKALGEAAKTFGKSTGALHRTAIGATVGGLGGALSGGGYNPNPVSGQMEERSRLKRGLLGAAAGAAAGGLSHGEGRKAVGNLISKTGSMQKVAVLPAIGGMLARGAAAPAMKRMAIGAGIGAAGGALKTPGIDPTTGQQKSRLGAIAVGAGLGAAAGKALPRGVSALGARSSGLRSGINAAASGMPSPPLANIANRTNASAARLAVTKPVGAPTVAAPAYQQGLAQPGTGQAPAALGAPTAGALAKQHGLGEGAQATLAGVSPAHAEAAAARLKARAARQASTVEPERALAMKKQVKRDTTFRGKAEGAVESLSRRIHGQPQANNVRLASVDLDRVNMNALYQLMLERTGRT